MSTLDQGLAVGNSLTGIGSIEEALAEIEPGALSGEQSLFRAEVDDQLGSARELLERVALLSEASVSEADEAVALLREARLSTETTRMALDSVVASRLGILDLRSHTGQSLERLAEVGSGPEVQAAVAPYKPAHLPVLFPSVFTRERPGFDVVLGNPPWDEVMIEEPKFWQRRSPGVMGLKAAAQKKRIKELRAANPHLVAELDEESQRMADLRALLIHGPYPGLTKGDIDYYKAFSWRMFNAVRAGGRLGAVFPRSLLNAAGSAKWREHILANAFLEAATSLTNTGRWVFDDVDGRYSITLVVASKSTRETEPAEMVRINGPFHSRREFEIGAEKFGSLKADRLVKWGNGAAFPLLPSARSAEIFDKFRSHPRFDDHDDDWDLRPVTEFHATNDRSIFDAGDPGPGRIPVLTGASFNLWDPNAGDPYAWGDVKEVEKALFERRRRQSRHASSAFFGLPEEIVEDAGTLPFKSVRIAFRDVTNQTNTRTFISALIPPGSVLTNKAPYLVSTSNNHATEAFALGLLSSIPFDWYARRFVELSVNFHILNAFPIPRPVATNPHRLRLIEIAGRLAAIDGRFKDWADQVDVPVGSVRSESERNSLIFEVDALVAVSYGIDRDDLTHIFETFHRGWDYDPRLEAVLEHFDRITG